MERVGTLINKLKEQFDQGLDADKLAVTAQLLLGELQYLNRGSEEKSHVSVVLPTVKTISPEPEPANQEQTIEFAGSEPGNSWLFDHSAELPTLTHQVQVNQQESGANSIPLPIPEFNTVLARPSESLNEKLKEHRDEVANVLQGSPIRDLKKAIGVNDKFLFVNDLFRGDENMYERSLKTINNFNIYPEAQYWIQRELKVKLSWSDNSETVKLFDQLVKRRFS
ncbi:MAG: hypothetical protein RLZZ28_1331 [Bacteroidota bacterium]|jgi:hypothetical protein